VVVVLKQILEHSSVLLLGCHEWMSLSVWMASLVLAELLNPELTEQFQEREVQMHQTQHFQQKPLLPDSLQ
jgi:hypothetical protein